MARERRSAGIETVKSFAGRASTGDHPCYLPTSTVVVPLPHTPADSSPPPVDVLVPEGWVHDDGGEIAEGKPQSKDGRATPGPGCLEDEGGTECMLNKNFPSLTSTDEPASEMPLLASGGQHWCPEHCQSNGQQLPSMLK